MPSLTMNSLVNQAGRFVNLTKSASLAEKQRPSAERPPLIPAFLDAFARALVDLDVVGFAGSTTGPLPGRNPLSGNAVSVVSLLRRSLQRRGIFNVLSFREEDCTKHNP